MVRIFFCDGKDLVDQRLIEHGWDKVCSDPLQSVCACVTLREHRRAQWLDGDDFCVRILFFEISACACECSTCADARYEDIDVSFGIAPNFRSCCFIVRFGVDGVVEL